MFSPSSPKGQNPLSVALDALKKHAKEVPNPLEFASITGTPQNQQEIIASPTVKLPQARGTADSMVKHIKTKRRKKQKKEHKDVNWYTIRNEICDGNEVHCPAFTMPLMDFGQDIESENDEYEEFKH